MENSIIRPQNDKVSAFKTLLSAELSPSRNYNLLISLLVPRPIAWVSSVSASGENNLAPFSFYGGLCGDPPMIGLGIARKSDGVRKDTAANILQVKEFVVHLAEIKQLAEIEKSAEELPAGESEAEKLGLQLVPSQVVQALSLADSPVRLECKLIKNMELGNGPVDYLIAEVIAFVLPEHYLDDKGRVIGDLLSPVGRLGGKLYAPVDRSVGATES